MTLRVLLTSLAVLLATAATAEDRNVLSRITVDEGEAGAVVRIEGSRAPSFTQFELDAPRRVVIDLSGAVLAGPAAEIPAQGRQVRVVRTAAFQAGRISVARVTVEMTGDFPYELATEGTDLVMTLHGAPKAPAPVAQKGPDPAAQARADADAALALAESAKVDAARARQEAARLAEEAARMKAEAEAARAKALAEAKRAAASDEAVAAARAAQEKAEAAAQAARQALEAAQARARRAEAQVAETQAKLEAALARVQAVQAESEEARRLAEARAEREAQARAEAERKLREAEARARKAAELAARRAAEQAKTLRDAREGVIPGVAYAYLQYQDPEDYAGGENAPVRASDAPKVMSLVGFQQQGSISRVFIRTNEPVRYDIRPLDPNTIVIELPNTRARTRNDLNYLDTRFFDTAVAIIDPEEIEGAQRYVRITIRLKQSVPYEVRQVDNEIQIDFQRP
ncbi:MAG: AMIN domain-containing protein [Deltaproteobacteria bacterium]|nr:MAG: AMIN domain-containing protein [Deltaproteobacteria bacterium]